MRPFTFHPGPRLIAGAGKSEAIADLLPEGPVLFVTDAQLLELSLVDSCLQALEASGRPVTIFDQVEADPSRRTLEAAVEAAAQLGGGDLPIVSLAKREEEVFLPGRSESLRLPRRSPALRLLQRARDEAHRFGLAYNRKRRTDRTITSELLTIPGVGPMKRRQLLERFGSLAGVRSASVAELASVPGVSTRLAERILDRLKQGAGR
jgi:hypothetical protein